MSFFLLLTSVFLISAGGTAVALMLLRKYRVMDVPNARSNHATPTPRGGGIAVIIALFLGFISVAFFFQQDINALIPLYSSIFLLTLISFYDDLHGVSIKWRLSFQIIAIAIGLYFLPPPHIFPAGIIPPALETILIGMGWLWFINLYNFMDGIDGITGTETACIGIAVALLSLATIIPLSLTYYSLIIAASALGFLLLNWHPAKIFMGDVGSVSLGYITFWLLLQLAAEGFLVAALIIPAYYIADSTVTLVKRALQGKRFWEGHSEHFYQQAVRSGYSHTHIVYMVIAINSMLAALALLSTLGGFYALFSLCAAIILTSSLLAFWHRKKTNRA